MLKNSNLYSDTTWAAKPLSIKTSSKLETPRTLCHSFFRQPGWAFRKCKFPSQLFEQLAVQAWPALIADPMRPPVSSGGRLAIYSMLMRGRITMPTVHA